MSITNYNFEDLSTYLAKEYYIPDYQRDYSWDINQLEDFWFDLLSVQNDAEDAEHFFGQIVVHKSTEQGTTTRNYIIDGQQRTITSVIFLSVVRNHLKKLLNGLEGKTDLSSDIGYDIQDITASIGRYTDRRDERHLVLNTIDRQFFADYIQSTTHGLSHFREDSTSNIRIRKAYDYFFDKLQKELEDKEQVEKFNLLSDRWKDLTKRFKVMYVETNDLNEAFIIFETLNDRGKSLATSDLLKNHLFSHAGKQNIEKVESNWSEMVNYLGKADTTKFIRSFWNSRQPFVRERGLYKALKGSSINEVKLSEDLANLAKTYNNLEFPKTSDYFDDGDIRTDLIALNHLGAKSYYPIVLAVVSKNKDISRLHDVLTAIETLVVRNFVISGLSANKYEIFFAKVAMSYSSDLIDIEALINSINKKMVSDSEFQNNFKTAIVKQREVIRYLLRKLNSAYTKSDELEVVKDNSVVHIEHIFPQRPHKNTWYKFDDVESSEFLWRIGNLTLLSNKLNQKIANSGFDVKKEEAYKISQIAITKDLLNFKDWTPQSIECRQDSFAKIATSIWIRTVKKEVEIVE
ncbi:MULTISPECIES: DUF262 domain-containing protein [Lactobacillaceae]|uniref:DUF262 domain-containing protein n=1 Tax=Lactobacillaceae TaxID=33958 RepID=UPI0014567AB3|nr:DUF262 domain-containing protein [Lactobacillus sp. HBUAS51381]NLR10751.1 DUF262 domain-containing protein [Lactobacillus sp. HBUAS51381]